MNIMREPEKERWREYIRQRVKIDPKTGCWLWQQHRDKHGYGHSTHAYNHGLDQEAHRAAYHVFKGRIPKGKQVRHQCHNPPCCNPDHLLLGVQKDNVADNVRDGRVLNGQTLLTRAQVLEIKRLLKARALTLSNRAIAKKFGVCPATITLIKTGKNWKSVPSTK